MRYLVDARPLMDPTSGGVARVARGIIDALIATSPNDEIVLVTTGREMPQPDTFPTSPTVRHVHLHIPNKLWSLSCLLRLASLEHEIKKRVGKIDAAFLPNLGFVGSRSPHNSALTTPPYVLLLHDLSFLIEPRWFSRKQRLWHRAVGATSLIQNATHLLAVSETTKRDAMRLLDIPGDRITVIPLGPTMNSSVGPIHELALQGDRRYLLALGWNDPRKNARTAVRAHDILKHDPAFADLDLIIVGRDRIRPTDEELATLYSHASAFLYPSWYEGYGLPLHEAAAYGTPCIASTAGALPETAPPGTIFADPAKPHHWAEAIKYVVPTGAHRNEEAPTKRSLHVGRNSGWTEASHILRDILSCAIS